MEDNITVNKKEAIWTISGWLFGALVFVTGLFNLFLVHPVPAVAYFLISFLYFPPANAYFRKKAGFAIPVIVKVLLGIVLIMFTLGVSDLGDMIDKL